MSAGPDRQLCVTEPWPPPASQEMACSPHRMIGARGKAEGGFDLDNPVVRSSLYGTEPNGVAQLPMSAAASSSVATEQQ
eukprot:5722684-Prymnesium_polylepis.1